VKDMKAAYEATPDFQVTTDSSDLEKAFESMVTFAPNPFLRVFYLFSSDFVVSLPRAQHSDRFGANCGNP
jgi:hypothetical protein